MFRQIRKAVSVIILSAFIITSVKSPVCAQLTDDEMPRLPAPGVMVHLSPEFVPAQLQGITIHPDNALQFDFLIHKGDQDLEGDQKKEEYRKLIKYFLASLTIPDRDQWVNLSPYEKDRIIKDDFGKTEMGRDLLAEDYLLKQITSSLIYPEAGLGKKFWNKVYERAWKEYHTTNIPVNTFNKVWIVPDQAIVYESGNTAYILKSHLKVMLEEDYLSLEKHSGITSSPAVRTHTIGSQVIREIILPELEREVNEGENFANLRQIYSGMVLATWYKKVLKDSLLGQVYVNKEKVDGINLRDPGADEEIYQRYLKAFKKGVFNYIKEDVDKYTNEAIPRKYFSGGFDRAMQGREGDVKIIHDLSMLPKGTIENLTGTLNAPMDDVTVNMQGTKDAAMFASYKTDWNKSLDKVPGLIKTNQWTAAKQILDEARWAIPQYRIKLRYRLLDLEELYRLSKGPDVTLYPQYASPKPRLIIDVINPPKYKIDWDKKFQEVEDYIREGKWDAARAILDWAIVEIPRRRVLPKSSLELRLAALRNLYNTASDFRLEKNGKVSFNPEGQRKFPLQDWAMLTGGLQKLGDKVYRSTGYNLRVHGYNGRALEKNEKMIVDFLRTVIKQGVLQVDLYARFPKIDPVLIEDAALQTDFLPIEEKPGWYRFRQKHFEGAVPTNERLPKIRVPYAQWPVEDMLNLVDLEPGTFIYLTQNDTRVRYLIQKEAGDKIRLWVDAGSDMGSYVLPAKELQGITINNGKVRLMKPGTIEIGAGMMFPYFREGKDDELLPPEEGNGWFQSFSKILILKPAELLKDEAMSVKPVVPVVPVGNLYSDGQNAGQKQEGRVITLTFDAGFAREEFEFRKDQIKERLEAELKSKGDFGAVILQVGKRQINPVPRKNLYVELDALAQTLAERAGNMAMLSIIPNTPMNPVADGKTPGGIDFNSANLNLQIKRDGRGVPLPLAQQDMAQLSRIQGFEPEIIEIKPIVDLPILSELQQKLQSSSS